MKKPSLLIIFLVLVVAANTEIPELLHLSDNTSNDFSVSASERAVRGLSSQAPVPPVPVEIPDQTYTCFSAWPSARPSQVVAETDLLTLYSIHRT